MKAESQLCLNPYFHRWKSPPIPFTSSGQMISGFPAQMNSRKKADSSLQLINFHFSWTWQGKQECHQAQTYSCKEKETRSSPVTIRKEGALGGCMFTVKVVVS